MLFIYLCTTIIKRIIHNLIYSDALCMKNNVQCTFYIMFCKFMQFNKKILKQYLNIFVRNFVLFIQIRFVSTEKTTRIASRAFCFVVLTCECIDNCVSACVITFDKQGVLISFILFYLYKIYTALYSQNKRALMRYSIIKSITKSYYSESKNICE